MMKSARAFTAVVGVAVICGATVHARAEQMIANTMDTDSYVFIGTNNTFATELTVGVDLSGTGVYHFNFGVVEFADLDGLTLAGNKFLRIEAEAYASTQIVDGFPVTTLSGQGSAVMKLVALSAPYSDYLLSSDKAGWYDTYVGGAEGVAALSFSGQGVFEVSVAGAVDAWLSGANENHGFALVLTSGQPVEIGASEGGNGVVLTDMPLMAVLPGDTDGDGDVDDSDLGTALSNYSGPGAGLGKGVADGDTDADGDVDDSDLGTALSNYTGPLVASVPEPGVLGCLSVILGTMMLRHRRSNGL